jgi:hypothetical protein
MDRKSEYGQLKIQKDNLNHLVGYNFNQACSLRSVFNTRFTTSANRETGKLMVNIPSFIPSERIKPPKGSTHYKIVSAGYVYDFDKDAYKGQHYSSAVLAWDDVPTEDLQIELSVPENSSDPLFIYFGLEFMQKALGKFTPVSLYKLDPLCIVDVFTE